MKEGEAQKLAKQYWSELDEYLTPEEKAEALRQEGVVLGDER